MDRISNFNKVLQDILAFNALRDEPLPPDDKEVFYETRDYLKMARAIYEDIFEDFGLNDNNKINSIFHIYELSRRIKDSYTIVDEGMLMEVIDDNSLDAES